MARLRFPVDVAAAAAQGWSPLETGALASARFLGRTRRYVDEDTGAVDFEPVEPIPPGQAVEAYAVELLQPCVVDGQVVPVDVQLYVSNVAGTEGNLGWLEHLIEPRTRLSRLARPYPVDLRDGSDASLTIRFPTVTAPDAPAPTAGRLRVFIDTKPVRQ